MTNIIINDKNRTIEISKKFANEARKFGTEEYKELQEARQTFPRYKVAIRNAGKSRDHFKGLNYAYMREYIEKKSDETTLIEFYTLCGKDENGKDLDFAPVASYGQIKAWFLESFPEITTKRKTIDEILGKKKAA